MLKYLKLSSSYTLNNMHLFNAERIITKYEKAQQIINEFYEVRMKGYQLRKRYLVSKFEKENMMLTNQIKFIRQMLSGEFQLVQSKEEWVKRLREGRYTKFQELNRIESTKNREEDENEKNRDYQYLLSMPILSFCQENIRQMESIQTDLNAII